MERNTSLLITVRLHSKKTPDLYHSFSFNTVRLFCRFFLIENALWTYCTDGGEVWMVKSLYVPVPLSPQCRARVDHTDQYLTTFLSGCSDNVLVYLRKLIINELTHMCTVIGSGSRFDKWRVKGLCHEIFTSGFSIERPLPGYFRS